MLHIHTFADGACTQCGTTLADWQQELYAEIRHIALGDEGDDDCGCRDCDGPVPS
jgi:hypothetical protein